jgi:DNA mismatch repair protein MutL
MGLPAGTSVIVRDLFYNVPARRKFLKSETTELGHIASLATHYALAHPEKSFVLKTPTQEIVNVGPVADYQERVFQIFGKQALDELIELKETRLAAPPPPWEGGTEAEEAGETMPHPAEMVVRGFVSKPEVQRPNRNAIYVFVNRRLVRDRLILHAIHEAYRNILPSHTFPSVLLFLGLPFAEVDVNVHPSKVEVRFRHSAWVHDGVREAVRAALMAAEPQPWLLALVWVSSRRSQRTFRCPTGQLLIWNLTNPRRNHYGLHSSRARKLSCLEGTRRRGPRQPSPPALSRGWRRIIQ